MLHASLTESTLRTVDPMFGHSSNAWYARPFLTISLMCLLVVGLAGSFGAAHASEPRKGPLAGVRSWGYQLQNLDLAHLARSPHDLLVIDFSRGGGGRDEALTANEITRLKARPGQPDRIVLAYLSIGEAEVYRDYWRWYWGGRWYTRPFGWFLAPSWLGAENPEWRGNFAVRYWDDSWQRLILGSGPGANDGYLDTILAAGFDGVYLDKVDASVEAIARGRPSGQVDMRTLVRRIAEKGRAKRPGFLVVPQNGEELLGDEPFVALIDGLAKEDLLYGEFKEKKANPERAVTRRLGFMAPLTVQGKTVLAVEYLDDVQHIAAARQRLEGFGYVPTFADRALKTLRHGDGPATAGAKSR